ncbi:MAG: polysaccharide pyruvyl transferase family protein [Bacillaceae bacterium]|nr:polysaccharide pyruvyl transferase family protein [Bacillaceae bacterium]
MESVLILDTSVGSLNKGDDIIMKCVNMHLMDITKDKFVLTLPTHLQPFSSFQVFRNSNRIKVYNDATYKFVGGSNLLTMNMLTHFPQWNINLFNSSPLKGSVLFGVGAGKGNKINRYTKMLYKKVLSSEHFHSVRDERTKKIMENIGLRAINTGCPTLWKLTPEHCKRIPTQKSSSVIFTLAHHSKSKEDQQLIDILVKNYEKVYFWVQDASDLDYFNTLKNIDKVNVVPPTLDDFERVLNNDIDYVGVRLHGGIYAMRQLKRTIIISIDERAKGMSETYHLNTIERENIASLETIIQSKFETKINLDMESINKWKSQFI